MSLPEIILASKSPRRRELLGRLYPEFKIFTLEVDESLDEGIDIKCGTELLAIRKGEAVSKEIGQDSVVISSDTLVELDGVALGKPADEEAAFLMLSQLSGRAHNVHTGVAVHYKGRVFSSVATSRVHFRDITPEEIREYIATGEPMDKAGSYGIQGEGGKFVLGYDGDFDTIMGLSVGLTEKLVNEALEACND